MFTSSAPPSAPCHVELVGKDDKDMEDVPLRKWAKRQKASHQESASTKSEQNIKTMSAKALDNLIESVVSQVIFFM